jgi:hypothetical protein
LFSPATSYTLKVSDRRFVRLNTSAIPVFGDKMHRLKLSYLRGDAGMLRALDGMMAGLVQEWLSRQLPIASTLLPASLPPPQMRGT